MGPHFPHRICPQPWFFHVLVSIMAQPVLTFLNGYYDLTLPIVSAIVVSGGQCWPAKLRSPLGLVHQYDQGRFSSPPSPSKLLGVGPLTYLQVEWLPMEAPQKSFLTCHVFPLSTAPSYTFPNHFPEQSTVPLPCALVCKSQSLILWQCAVPAWGPACLPRTYIHSWVAIFILLAFIENLI